MARNVRKKYSEEFKGQAVRLARELGHAKAARQLGISEASLSYWKKTNQGKEKLSEAEQIAADREELQRLRKETAEQKQVILILKKAAAFFFDGPTEVKFELVQELNTANGVAVNLSCKTLDVSRSGYYAWLLRGESQRATEDKALLPRIRAIHEKSKQTYGSPRVTAELRAEGEVVNEKRVARLMRENEIASEAVKKFKVQTTDSNHDLPIADRIFETEHADSVMAPDQVYVGDITYVWTEEGFLFLAVFMDIFTRKIVGHKADDNMRAELVLEALSMALGRQDVKPGQVIAHSDQGSQYASEKLRQKMELVGIIASMSRKGNCWDNAHCESFFHSLKAELVYRTNFKTREEAKQAIFAWIECWYNSERRHSALGYMAPNEYEKLAKVA